MFLVSSGLAMVAIDPAQASGAFVQAFLAFRVLVEAIFLALSNVEACGLVKNYFCLDTTLLLLLVFVFRP
jgi:hypothetical protein